MVLITSLLPEAHSAVSFLRPSTALPHQHTELSLSSGMHAPVHSAWRSVPCPGRSQWASHPPCPLQDCAQHVTLRARHCSISPSSNAAISSRATQVVISVEHQGHGTIGAAVPSVGQLQPFSGASTAACQSMHHEAIEPQQQQQQQQQRAVLLEGHASTTGALPEVLQRTFPESFPTPTSARRGER